MNNQKNDPFAGLDSDIQSGPSAHAEFANRAHAMMAGASSKVVSEFVERCGSCGGTGRFHSYAGRFVGECFKCAGTGELKFKTSPETRQKSKEKAAKKKAAEKQERANVFWDWFDGLGDAEKAAQKWLSERVIHDSFWSNHEMAQSLVDRFRNRTPWSEKQMAVVIQWHEKAKARAIEKAEKKQAEMTPCAVSEKFVELFGLFANAKSAQKAKPILRAEGLRISEAKENSANAGCLYVTDAEDHWEDRTYLGKITPSGQFVRSKDCTDQQSKAVESVALDPLASALKYGRLTGQCSCCGRELTNHKSVEDGIGPICREKWGM
jgi:hypothetical protein